MLRGLGLALSLALVAHAAGPAGCAPAPREAAASSTEAVRTALRRELKRAPAAMNEVGAFYEARGWEPLWVLNGALRPEAPQLLQRLKQSADHGLEPGGYRLGALSRALGAARGDGPEALARAELELSAALALYARDLDRPAPGAALLITDPSLATPPSTTREVLEDAAAAPSLSGHLAALERRHPVYDALRQALANHRRRWSGSPSAAVPPGPTLAAGAGGERVDSLRVRLGLDRPGATEGTFDPAMAERLREFQADHGLRPTGAADPRTVEALNAPPQAYERLIRLNLERARALPTGNDRHVLVDAAGARLWLYEDGQVRDSMRVVVGSAAHPTPMMAGLIRYAVFAPYWNVPKDLVRDRLARQVLHRGVETITAQRFQVLPDWSAQARPLDPAGVDWEAVAAGRAVLRVRQEPGPGNMMGAVKFMLPNRLGIYLHDTPGRAAFSRSDRRLSAGCVRVEDARRLARWLIGGVPTVPPGAADQRVDLTRPTPVYISYFTVMPEAGGLKFHADGYGRDEP